MMTAFYQHTTDGLFEVSASADNRRWGRADGEARKQDRHTLWRKRRVTHVRNGQREWVDAKKLTERPRLTPATVYAWLPFLRAGRRPTLFDVGAEREVLRRRAERTEVLNAS